MSFISDALGFGGSGANFTAKGSGQDALDAGVKSTEQGLAAQHAMNQQLAAANGIGNQTSVFNQLQGVANGTGPNPAQAMLAQQTGANTANQAALMAGQRGAGANPALIARQAAMQGAANQQNAIGQGATMQANQSLNAMGQLGGIANQQVAQQMQGVQGFTNAAQNYQNASLNSMANQNTSNAATQAENAKNKKGLLGGIGSAVGGVLTGGASSLVGMAEGGVVPSHMPRSSVGMYFHGGQVDMSQGGHVPGQASVAGDSYQNDKVKALLSPKEIVVPRSITMSDDAPKKAADFVAAILAKNGMKK